jgi:hypothetical protein
MNQTYNKDIKYSFLRRCVNPVQTLLIDEDWIKEKNIEMEIPMPFKNLEGVEEDSVKNSNEILKWSDLGMEELVGRSLSVYDLNKI